MCNVTLVRKLEPSVLTDNAVLNGTERKTIRRGYPRKNFCYGGDKLESVRR